MTGHLLTPEETTFAQERLRQYTRTARIFSGGVLAAIGAFVWKLARLRSAQTGDLATVGVLFAFVVLAGALAWRFGWRQIVAMKADLSAGRKECVEGPVEWLDRQDNAYGQTVTHLKVAGRRATSREPALATVKKGDRVELDFLPASGVVLSCRVVA